MDFKEFEKLYKASLIENSAEQDLQRKIVVPKIELDANIIELADMFAGLGEDIIEASRNIADAINDLASNIYYRK